MNFNQVANAFEARNNFFKMLISFQIFSDGSDLKVIKRFVFYCTTPLFTCPIFLFSEHELNICSCSGHKNATCPVLPKTGHVAFL